MNEVLVSVVMPVYNREDYVHQSIESILSQTYSNFEFIIINDGSVDRTEEIILAFKDERIKYYKNEHNIGNNATRNKGMKLAKGKYIAIMDSDDISVPDRLETQLKYLKTHPETGILGGFKIFFDEKGYFLQSYPTNPEYLKSYLFFKNAIGQPTVMLRREIIIKHNLFYLPELENMGDYNLWYRASLLGIQIKNIPEVLLYYRMSESQIGSRKLDDRNRKLTVFFKERLAMIDISLTDADFMKFHQFIRGKVSVDNNDYILINELLDLIEKKNKEKMVYEIISFRAALFYFRLRLIKYHFLEYQNNKLNFSTNLIKLLAKTGLNSLQMFWQNEGKYLNKSGRSHKREWQKNQDNFFKS